MSGLSDWTPVWLGLLERREFDGHVVDRLTKRGDLVLIGSLWIIMGILMFIGGSAVHYEVWRTGYKIGHAAPR